MIVRGRSPRTIIQLRKFYIFKTAVQTFRLSVINLRAIATLGFTFLAWGMPINLSATRAIALSTCRASAIVNLEESTVTSSPSLSMPTNTEVELERLLQTRIQHPDRAAEIDAQIRARFMETHAIMVLDSSGFSRLAQEQGIIAALAEIERMRGIVSPIVEGHQGSPFKLEADNVYAVFPSVERAIAASRETMRQLATIDKHVSIGIGYGDLIMISDGVCYHDVYGEEMNLASKLGEDLAAHDEVLLTEAAVHQLHAERPATLPVLSPAPMTISNLTLQVYRLTPSP